MPIKYIRIAKVDALTEMAATMEPAMRKAFLDAIKSVRDKIDMKALADAILAGDMDKAVKVLDVSSKLSDALKGAGLSKGSFRQVIQDTFLAGAKTALKDLPSKISTELAFDQLSPEAIAFLRNYEFERIVQITSEARDTIRGVLLDAFQEGGHPYEQARLIRDSIGLTSNQAKAVDRYADSLRNLSSDALDRALRDARFDGTVARAIESGENLSSAQIDKMVARYQERYLNYRAQTIARTETIRASQKGQAELWQQAVDQGLIPRDVQRVWITADDDRTCDFCDDLDGEEAGLEEEFMPGVMEPPAHPDCRCSVALQLGNSLSS